MSAASLTKKPRHSGPETRADKALRYFSSVFIVLFCIFCLLPFVLVIITSFTDERVLMFNGYAFWPERWSIAAYRSVLSKGTIGQAYKVSIFVTLVGTALSMLFTVIMAYPLSVKKLPYRTGLAFFLYFTMLFGGGLVPSYLLISKYLGMKDSIWVLIIPSMCSAWNIFLMRNFFSSIPEDLAESAYIDGANDPRILLSIILPVSVPGIATISLFYALGYWNAWFNAMLYINDNNLRPLQYLIMKILREINEAKRLAEMTNMVVPEGAATPTKTVQMATTVLTIGPIIFAYPFVQKYFTGGLMVGSIKG